MARAVLVGPAVNSNISDPRRAVWDATEHFLVGDAPALADELTDALLSVSAHVARFRRHLPNKGALAEEMRAVDTAFGESVALARRLSLAVREHSEPGGYANASSIARELAKHVAPAMPEGGVFAFACPAVPALVAMPPTELRRILATLIRRVLEGLGESRGELSLHVSEVRDGGGVRSSIAIAVAHPALPPAVAAEAAELVRSNVNAAGGAVEPCARPAGGSAVVLSLLAAC
jgi:hypothetical protein